MRTPVTCIDKIILEKNINQMQLLADSKNKLLMPMMKTHKSTQIAKMQLEAGCYGFLCGTIDECIAAYSIGAKNVMYAYPISNIENLQRLCKISKETNIMLRTDSYECAMLAKTAAEQENLIFQMSVIVDSGLHRFGLEPSKAANLAYQISSFSNIEFIGFSTHPGHVYKKTYEYVEQIAKEECESLVLAKKELLSLGVKTKFLTTGSTPTVRMAVNCKDIDIIHPGNYVFNDFIQISLKAATEEDCALTVSASIVSNPEEGIFIMDAGAKCLGLDKGAHGNSAILGYGYILDHPKACVVSLSEEVGIISANQEQFSIGDIICIIPNHSCSTANLTNRLYCIEEDEYIDVDIRGNSYNFYL